MIKSTKIPQISIVIPVYNSQDIIQELFKRVNEVFASCDLDIEVIAINDCSPDQSFEMLKKVQKSYSYVRIYNNEVNLGQATTSLKGISLTKGKYIVTIDDDLEYAPEDILRLYDTIKHGHADVVFGLAKDKYKLQGKHQGIARFRNYLLNKLWNKPVTDSFKIFKRTLVFRNEDFLPQTHFEGFISSLQDRVSIAYLPVDFNQRFKGQSNYTFWKKVKLFIQMNKGFKQ